MSLLQDSPADSIVKILKKNKTCVLYPEVDDLTATLMEEDWDFIVLQTYSLLPTIQKSREVYLEPAIAAFDSKRKKAKLILYLTWGYRSGNTISCPTSGSEKCFPLGSNAQLTRPPCNTSRTYSNKVNSFECMGYAVARGYMDQLWKPSIDAVVPAGIAWQTMRGALHTPMSCKNAIDEEYISKSPFSNTSNLSLPLRVDGLPPNLAKLELFRKLENGDWDKHPNIAGQYLNALVFYTTIFRESPVGAAGPLKTGTAPRLPLEKDILNGMQRVAESVVLDHAEHWYSSSL